MFLFTRKYLIFLHNSEMTISSTTYKIGDGLRGRKIFEVVFICSLLLCGTFSKFYRKTVLKFIKLCEYKSLYHPINN